jgi:hypothetical protein
MPSTLWDKKVMKKVISFFFFLLLFVIGSVHILTPCFPKSTAILFFFFFFFPTRPFTTNVEAISKDSSEQLLDQSTHPRDKNLEDASGTFVSFGSRRAPEQQNGARKFAAVAGWFDVRLLVCVRYDAGEGVGVTFLSFIFLLRANFLRGVLRGDLFLLNHDRGPWQADQALQYRSLLFFS